MLQIARAALPLSLSVILCACAANARDVHPALWKASSKTATIYFFGTIHALPKDENWRTPALVKAEAEANALVLELSDVGDQAKVQSVVRELALAPNLPDVLDRVPPEKRAGLQALLAQSGAPLAALKAYKSWAVFLLVIEPLVMKAIGVDGAEGVERKLTADFNGAHKPIEGLETIKYQLGIFNNLPEAQQRKLLSSSIDDLPQAKAKFALSLKAWESGDPAAIAKYFDEELKAEPELRRVLIHDRNANWAAWTLARLKQRGVTLVAVGAGHLAGSDSLIAMLRAKGVKVARVG